MEDVAYKSLRPQGREGRLRLEGRGAKGKKIIFSSFSNMLKGQAAGGPRSTFYFFCCFRYLGECQLSDTFFDMKNDCS